MRKHWPNNLGVGSFPTNVVELVEVNVKFEEELEEFDGSFDIDEMVDMYFFSFFIVHLFFLWYSLLFCFFSLNHISLQNM